MSGFAELIDATLAAELTKRIVPLSVDALAARLAPLTMDLRQRVPVAFRGFPMFRIQPAGEKPLNISSVGAPPNGSPKAQRLNEAGQTVLYLSDSPATAFAERGALLGEYCLSEWTTTAEKLLMVNGGIPPEAMLQFFSQNISEGRDPFPLTPKDEQILSFLREIYTLDADSDKLLYRWSIACARSNGFSHVCELTGKAEANGITQFQGPFPFAAIAYPSVRTDPIALNFAFNDRGRSLVHLNYVQWIRISPEGKWEILDFADRWDASGDLLWTGKPGFVLKPGARARVIKTSATEWCYEID
jgi:hypothetical protein